MIQDLCAHFKLFLVFSLNFGVDESCSSDNSLLRDAKLSRSSFFRSDKDFVRSVLVLDFNSKS